ncbi:MAG TPA: HAD family phosphatase [Alphaproteobacteria bacterium]|jgi:HAD superfamily hydrolase (TIGR01509 family)
MALIFDNDGVLVNSEETAIFHDPVFLEQFGLHYTVPEYAALISGKTHDAFVAALEANALSLTDRPLPPDFNDQLKQNYHWQVENIVTAIPGSEKIIHDARSLREAFAVASNGEMKTLRQKLAKAQYLEYFEPHIYNKDHVKGVGKPAPDLFLFTMRKLGETNPARCIVIEDSASGIRAGVAAGMCVIGYAGGKHRAKGYGRTLYDAGAREVSDDMEEINAMVMRRIARNRTPLPPTPQ